MTFFEEFRCPGCGQPFDPFSGAVPGGSQDRSGMRIVNGVPCLVTRFVSKCPCGAEFKYDARAPIAEIETVKEIDCGIVRGDLYFTKVHSRDVLMPGDVRVLTIESLDHSYVYSLSFDAGWTVDDIRDELPLEILESLDNSCVPIMENLLNGSGDTGRATTRWDGFRYTMERI
ncbi:MAG: hypothetical protein IJ026_05620 [Candidatus Methanomethylophilaceae archaeon]|nr:hypothetical protein [Candidatus Methanomethylophilaceae archaeon]